MGRLILGGSLHVREGDEAVGDVELFEGIVPVGADHFEDLVGADVEEVFIGERV